MTKSNNFHCVAESKVRLVSSKVAVTESMPSVPVLVGIGSRTPQSRMLSNIASQACELHLYVVDGSFQSTAVEGRSMSAIKIRVMCSILHFSLSVASIPCINPVFCTHHQLNTCWRAARYDVYLRQTIHCVDDAVW